MHTLHTLTLLVDEQCTIPQRSFRLPLLSHTLPGAALLLKQIDKVVRAPMGFYQLVQYIAELPATQNISPSDKRVNKLIGLFDHASRFTPFRADCFHQSIALTWLLRSQDVDAHLVIGCYSHPFVAHAWVESEEHIIQWQAGIGHFQDITMIQAMNRIFTTKEYVW